MLLPMQTRFREGHTRMQMTPSQQAKAISGHNLKTVSSLTGVRTQTLSNWAKHKPKCFYALLVGCKQLRLVDGEVLRVTVCDQ